MTLLHRPTFPDEPEKDDVLIIYREDGPTESAREVKVGRIFRADGGFPPGTPWFWAIDFLQQQGHVRPWYGYAATFVAAEEAWIRCWESASPPINWPRRTRNTAQS